MYRNYLSLNGMRVYRDDKHISLNMHLVSLTFRRAVRLDTNIILYNAEPRYLRFIELISYSNNRVIYIYLEIESMNTVPLWSIRL